MPVEPPHKLTTEFDYLLITAGRWLVYMIEADDGCLYTGITNNLSRRWQQHCLQKGGAKFFRGRKPMALRYIEIVADRSEASRREMTIKRLTRPQKNQLVANQSTASKRAVRLFSQKMQQQAQQ